MQHEAQNASSGPEPALEPYAERGANPTSNAEDGVLDADQLEALEVTVSEHGIAYLGVHTLGIDLPQSVTPTTSAATATPNEAATATPSPTADCGGDCSGDGTVTVDEMVQGVNMALGNAGAESCAAFDGDGNQQVTVSELVSAVSRLLDGCR